MTPSTMHSMILETTRFGPLDVAEDTVITMTDGIPGFPNLRKFVLVNADEEQPFYWIQDVDDGDLAFLAVVPWNYFPDYTFTLHDDDEFALAVEESTDLLILSLVTVDRDADQVTANLLGPVVINQKSKLARQIVMHGDFSTRAPLGAGS